MLCKLVIFAQPIFKDKNDMATVTPFIRTSVKKAEKVNIRFRLTDGRKIQLFHSSEITVNPDFWDSSKYEIKAKVIFNNEEKVLFNNKVAERKKLILDIYDKAIDKEALNSGLLDIEIDKRLHPEKYPSEAIEKTFFVAFDDFLKTHPLSEVLKTNYKVVKRALQRFELYQQKTVNSEYQITFDNFTTETLHKLDYFLKNEHTFFEEHKDIYIKIPESREPQQRGQNTMCGIYKKINTFLKCSKIKNNPFNDFEIPSETYGTPYYLTIEERNHLFNFDLSANPQLAIQRDIFIFQCLIGCRVGDLIKMKKSNYTDNAIQYIARKTKDKHPITVKVPLNETAKKILDRYSECENEKLLPFISEQNYNEAIKKAFKLAELNRVVTILNPTTREQEQRPLKEIASSHLARRTFIGNLYKKVKDPNLIGSLSGHKEGSRAFARYRDIDEKDKIELIKMLD